jgi:uncharacterized protein YbjT (DUF2867 family)
VLVLGGGLLGAAVARRVAAEGASVVVASRSPRAHPGLWRRVDLAGVPPSGLFVPGARVVWAVAVPDHDTQIAGSVLPRMVEHALRMGVAGVTVCVPGGAGTPAAGALARACDSLPDARVRVVRLAPLFGTDDRFVWPLVHALRDRGVARVPRGMPACWPLWVEDAARAVLRAPDGISTLRGPQRLEADEVGRAVADALEGRWGWRLFGGRDGAPLLAGQRELPDDWDDARFEARTTLGGWLARLPVVRRRR